MNETNIKVGSVVRLNSGDAESPEMTVRDVTDPLADVVWRADGKPYQAHHALASLRLVKNFTPETNIKVGSVVRLNSDAAESPKMAVRDITDPLANVVWSADGKPYDEHYALAGLRLVEDSDNEGIPPG